MKEVIICLLKKLVKEKVDFAQISARTKDKYLPIDSINK